MERKFGLLKLGWTNVFTSIHLIYYIIFSDKKHEQTFEEKKGGEWQETRSIGRMHLNMRFVLEVFLFRSVNGVVP